MPKYYLHTAVRTIALISALVAIPAFASTMGNDPAAGDAFDSVATAARITSINDNVAINGVEAEISAGIATTLSEQLTAVFPEFSVLERGAAFRLIQIAAGIDPDAANANKTVEVRTMLMIGAGLVMMGIVKTYAGARTPLD